MEFRDWSRTTRPYMRQSESLFEGGVLEMVVSCKYTVRKEFYDRNSQHLLHEMYDSIYRTWDSSEYAISEHHFNVEHFPVGDEFYGICIALSIGTGTNRHPIPDAQDVQNDLGACYLIFKHMLVGFHNLVVSIIEFEDSNRCQLKGEVK